MNPPLPVTPPATAPHSLNGNSVSRIMLTVIAALLPATVFSFWLYGWPAIFLWIVTIGAPCSVKRPACGSPANPRCRGWPMARHC